MTELMKRYEADFEKGLTHACYESWLENQVLDGKTIEKFQEIIRNQCDEISSLKAQLTWRPVSEKPEKSCKCIGKFDDGEMYDDLVYYDAKNDLWSRQVQNCFESWGTSYMPPIKYFIIPPAPEGE